MATDNDEFEDFTRPGTGTLTAEVTESTEFKSDTVSLLPDGKSDTVSDLASRLEKRVMATPAADMEYMGQAPQLSKTEVLNFRAERINKYHEGGQKAAQSLVCFAFLAGMELAAAKKALPHGKFAEWVAANLTEKTELTERTARRYIGLFQELKLKNDTVSFLAESAESLVGSGDDTGPRQKLLQAVHDATEGKTLTDLYREMGIIRQPKPAAYHPPKRSESELVADRLATIDGRWSALLALGYEMNAGGEDNFTMLTNERRSELRDYLRLTLERLDSNTSAKGAR